jgi:hypothetical protein
MSRPLLAGLALLLAFGTATAAFGQANTVQGRNFARWAAVDRCVASATLAFPDHDPVSLQKRDGMTDQCLADRKLPPRAHIGPEISTPAIVEPPEEKGGGE